MIGRHHPVERGDKAALRVGQEGRDPRERLVLLGVENVEDCADQQRMAGLLPVVNAGRDILRSAGVKFLSLAGGDQPVP